MRFKKILKSIDQYKDKLGIIILILFMTIGFAAISTSLYLSGHVQVGKTDEDFQVYIRNASLNGVGSSKFISSDKTQLLFSYSDIRNKEESLFEYTVRNTSRMYDVDVEMTCKAKNHDNTSFLYGEDKELKKRFTVPAGSSKKSSITITTPTTTSDISSSANLYNYIKSQSLGLDTSINYNNAGPTGVYETTKTDSGKSVYFYRGNIKNNNVIFANKCWLLARTTESGGVKLVYNGTPVDGTCLPLGASLSIESDTISIARNLPYNDNAYAGYMRGDIPSASYASAHANRDNSQFKSKIDEWYKTNLLNTKFENYLDDEPWCNDRSILTDYSNIDYSQTPTNLGYGSNVTYYQSSSRASVISKNLSPSLKCPNNADRFTKSASNGNGALTYPISIITADEAVYAGATKAENKNFWLYANNRSLFTLSPIGYYGDSINFTHVDGNGKLSNVASYSSIEHYVLPTVVVNSKMGILKGDGTGTDPLILSSEDIYENEYTCSMDITTIGRSEIGGSEDGRNLEVGEEYCLGEECFYVISNDNGTVKMLAKYNLYVGRAYTGQYSYSDIASTDAKYGKQHSTALGYPVDGGYPRIGTVAYSPSSNTSYASSEPKKYVDEYVEYLKATYNVNVSGELITYDQLVSLGCNDTDACRKAKYDWVTGLSYWTQTPGTGKSIYIVGADGFFKNTTGLTNVDNRGVRPVITITFENRKGNILFKSGDGTKVGDEVCILEECFNVINYDGYNYTLFAKNNLYVGRKYTSSSDYTTISTSDPLYGKQNATAKGDAASPWIGGVQYDSSSNVYQTSSIKNYVDEYVNYLNTSAGVNVSGRLATADEMESLGCTNDGNAGTVQCRSFKDTWIVGNQTFWLSTAGSATNRVYLVGGDGFFGQSAITSNGTRGVRPVILLQVSDVYEGIPYDWEDGGIYSEYYDDAYKLMKSLTTEEKVGQLLLARYPSDTTSVSEMQKYHLGGYVLFAKDFASKNKIQVQNIINNVQSASKIPLITAVDEEGGTVVRISSNTALRPTPFKAPREIYLESGLDGIISDTQEKSALLKELGLNVNLAPVLDISSETSYIYKRTLGQPASVTADFAKTVVQTSKGSDVSYTLKHFPGYGDNLDTHGSESVDTRTYEELMNNDLVPFISAIGVGAEAVLISHNTVTSIDNVNPASISSAMHKLLFETLGFTGISMTDDLSMGAVTSITGRYKKAVNAGNQLLIATNYADAYNEILAAVNSGEISQQTLEKATFKVLSWKYYKKMLNRA